MNSSSPALNKLLGMIPNWVGFGIIIVIGIAAIYFGATAPSAELQLPVLFWHGLSARKKALMLSTGVSERQ